MSPAQQTDPVPPPTPPPAAGATDAQQAPQIASVADGEFLTTNTGLRISDDQNTLKAGERGPSLLEDFHFREKMTHFDHERIPERVVHARGTGAHGVFQVYEPMTQYTRAAFLQDPVRRNAGLCALLDRQRLHGLGRHRARCPRLCHQVLYH